MDYREFQPNDRLAEFVQLIWVMESEFEDERCPRERILPDGIVELVFHYAEPFITHRADGSSYHQPKAFAISQMRQFIEIEPTGPVGMVCARFYPWGAYHFFQTPIQSFLDDQVDAETLWPEQYDELFNSICANKEPETKKQLVEEFLIARLNENERSDKRIDEAIRQIRHSAGTRSASELCEQLNISEKQLQRNFLASMGTTPKVFSRVSRFLYLCSHLADFRHKTLTELAYDCGYFDQAHFIKEFKQFSGFTPRQFFERNNVSFADI